jgi:hypothetical protein
MGNDPGTLSRNQYEIYKKFRIVLNDYLKTGNWVKEDAVNVLRCLMTNNDITTLSDKQASLHGKLKIILNQYIYNNNLEKQDIHKILECMV